MQRLCPHRAHRFLGKTGEAHVFSADNSTVLGLIEALCEHRRQGQLNLPEDEKKDYVAACLHQEGLTQNRWMKSIRILP